jgi:hypothetical protein
MSVDNAVGPLQSPPAQLPGTKLPRSGPVVPLPTKELVDVEPCHRRLNVLQEGKLAALHHKRVLAWNYLHKQITKALAAGSTPKLKVLSGEPLGKLQLVAAAYGWLGAVTADNREEVAESLLAKAREQRIAYRAVAVLVPRKSVFDSVAHQVASFMFGDATGAAFCPRSAQQHPRDLPLLGGD